MKGVHEDAQRAVVVPGEFQAAVAPVEMEDSDFDVAVALADDVHPVVARLLAEKVIARDGCRGDFRDEQSD